MIIDKATAIHSINPNAVFNISNDDYSTIEWLEGTTPISENDINNKVEELKVIENSEKENKITNQESGKAKLIELGLTSDEIKALMGV